MPRDTLTDRERKRLDRFEKMQQNRRGRSSPAVMPSKLARTAAFAPRKKNLVTDSNFKRVYEFRPHTVVEVSGRELGTQHRDALYALFKLRAKSGPRNRTRSTTRTLAQSASRHRSQR